MFKKIFPHVCIVLALFMLVLLIIDQINSAMAFIDWNVTKILLIILMLCVILLAVMYIAQIYKRTRR